MTVPFSKRCAKIDFEMNLRSSPQRSCKPMIRAIRTSITSLLSRFLGIVYTICSSVIWKPPLFRRYSITACLSSFAMSDLSCSSDPASRTLLPIILTPGVSVRSRFFLAKMALSRTAFARFLACSFFLSSPAGGSLFFRSDRSHYLLNVSDTEYCRR